MKAEYGIMRFAKYKGPEIGRIEAHDERTKESYNSNPDVDTSKSHLNFHLVEPAGKYRAEAEKQIAAAGCRTRKDSVRVVETLITASPEFFKGMKRAEVKAYFERALEFIKQHQDPKTMLSAVVHMDEKTPHMHLSFVPLTEDGRLSAKDILGNRKKLIWWQDEYWKFMVKKYPTLERGESASETGRNHISPRLFKEMTNLNRQRDRLDELLVGINPLNTKSRTAEIAALLDKFIPNVAKMDTQMKKFKGAYKALAIENKELTVENAALAEKSKGSVIKELATIQLQRDYDAAVSLLESIPPEVLAEYKNRSNERWKEANVFEER